MTDQKIFIIDMVASLVIKMERVVKETYRVVLSIRFEKNCWAIKIPISRDYIDIGGAKKSLAFIKNNYPDLDLHVIAFSVSGPLISS